MPLSMPILKMCYSETYLKLNRGIMETSLQRKSFTVLRIWSPEDPNFKYLYEKEPACNGSNFNPLSFRYRQVSLIIQHSTYNHSTKLVISLCSCHVISKICRCKLRFYVYTFQNSQIIVFYSLGTTNFISLTKYNNATNKSYFFPESTICSISRCTRIYRTSC